MHLKIKFRRVLGMLGMALLLGLLFNQLYSRGIKWPFLFAFSSGEKYARFVTVVSADTAFTLWEKGNTAFLDIRPREDFLVDHIPGAINLQPWQIFSSQMDSILATSQKILIYDEEGQLRNLRAPVNAILAQKKKPVLLLFGGYYSWLEAGFPLEKEPAHE